ncbi:hypothetical protein BVRB_030080 [Beta vulgaris subsp. vulgaris]|uniref:Uncharacterized protein n=1 Tax=Beta vulgaris subsp. vulgaris TaxID=3555 RepID=A0A0J8AXX1_BETVV|nr:hypothetical protein BVRB_030080 [Beta vulgaris subsp. vulgaris]
MAMIMGILYSRDLHDYSLLKALISFLAIAGVGIALLCYWIRKRTRPNRNIVEQLSVDHGDVFGRDRFGLHRPEQDLENLEPGQRTAEVGDSEPRSVVLAPAMMTRYQRQKAIRRPLPPVPSWPIEQARPSIDRASPQRTQSTAGNETLGQGGQQP